jgi:hypothetical protein
MTRISWRQALGSAVLVLTACLVLAGCRGNSGGSGAAKGDGSAGGADKVTRENFDKVKDGMTEPQVTAILGPPTDVSNPAMKVWKSGNNTISVGFKDGKVESKVSMFVK